MRKPRTVVIIIELETAANLIKLKRWLHDSLESEGTEVVQIQVRLNKPGKTSWNVKP